jgi:hypothetical protein
MKTYAPVPRELENLIIPRVSILSERCITDHFSRTRDYYCK